MALAGDPTDPNSGFSLYEYAGTGNAEPELVEIEPGPEEAKDRPAQHPAVISQCGALLGGGGGGGGFHTLDTYNAISSLPRSEQGRTVFFTAFANNHQCEEQGDVSPPVDELYARIGGSHTVAISEPTTGPAGDCEACDESEPKPALFQGANESGSKVFFLSEQELLPGAAGDNLYEYDFNAPQGEKVSLIAPRGAVMRVSADGSRVYLVSEAALPGAAANEFGVEPQAGAENLYAYDTETRAATFIAALAPGDEGEWGHEDNRGSVGATAPDGRFLVFGSVNDVTPDASGSARQLYRYDAQPTQAEEEAGVPRLVRVSVGDAASNDGNDGASSGIPAQGYPGVSSRVAVALDGTVFFNSAGALTPQALDQVCAYEEEGSCFSEANNVYEYENGHVYLLSDGRDTHSVFRGTVSNLVGASPSGSDVYLTSGDALVGGQGPETGLDYVFDARVGGGFPTPVERSCHGDPCQGSPSSAPSESPASTPGFNGPEEGPNHPQQAKKHHKHKKKGHKHHKPKKHGKRTANNNRRAGK